MGERVAISADTYIDIGPLMRAYHRLVYRRSARRRHAVKYMYAQMRARLL